MFREWIHLDVAVIRSVIHIKNCNSLSDEKVFWKSPQT